MNIRTLPDAIRYLFNRYWDESLPVSEEEKLEDIAEHLTKEFTWDDVYRAATDYLYKNCSTPESVINFASLFWNYGWNEFLIPEPYHFLSYFYYRIHFQTEKYDSMDILDSLSATILTKAGFSEADLTRNTQYMPENDPEMIAAAKEWASIFQDG